MLILFGIVVPVVFVLALFIGTREEKRWIRRGLLVAGFLLLAIGLIYLAVKR